ncbi:TetR family transcriptional regulator [Gephyromycinifex aptenodytis]|uniref:TetR family transcriptional regulator n=1 Tax=Gephyromycinifex aptenodytis TaxID=2716227 RepID=UPI00144608DA|nr:TetR family transcriptional regulator [Gephyromycinifex aptenodytis]
MGSDLTAHARIRNAGLELFAQLGYERTTVRAIAAHAQVSPALVLHHFGSKDGLRTACDAHLLDLMSIHKSAALSAMSPLSLSALLADSPQFQAPAAYLIRVLIDGGDLAGELFERIAAGVEDQLALGEKADNIKPSLDPAGRAAVLTAYGLGALVFQQPLARRLGGTALFDADVLTKYSRLALELYTQGLINPDLVTDDVDRAATRERQED